MVCHSKDGVYRDSGCIVLWSNNVCQDVLRQFETVTSGTLWRCGMVENCATGRVEVWWDGLAPASGRERGHKCVRSAGMVCVGARLRDDDAMMGLQRYCDEEAMRR